MGNGPKLRATRGTEFLRQAPRTDFGALAVPAGSNARRSIALAFGLRDEAGQKRDTLVLQLLLEYPRAVALAARPRFGAVFVPAIPARMRVFHLREFEILFPIRPLFRQGNGAKTYLDPTHGAVRRAAG